MSSTRVFFSKGNESRVKFGKDRWCGEELLCVIFPSLFALVESKEVWVVDLWEQREGGDKTLGMQGI